MTAVRHGVPLVVSSWPMETNSPTLKPEQLEQAGEVQVRSCHTGHARSFPQRWGEQAFRGRLPDRGSASLVTACVEQPVRGHDAAAQRTPSNASRS